MSQGQQNIVTTIRVRNNSNQDIDVDSLYLYSRVLGDANYTYRPRQLLPGVFWRARQLILLIRCDVSVTAATGIDTIDA